MLKAVIFDFDGVLGDTYQINFDVTKELVNGVKEQDFIDHHKGNVFAEPKVNYDPDSIDEFFARQKDNFTADHLFPLSEVLKELADKYQLFVISSTYDDNIDHFLALKDYDQYFTKVLGSQTHRSKAHKFQMVFDGYNLKPEECLFVTDTSGDIIEARGVGVRAIGVTWGYHSEELLRDQNPVAIVHDPSELLKQIYEF